MECQEAIHGKTYSISFDLVTRARSHLLAMAGTTAGAIVSGPTASMPSLAGLITVRLTRVNFLLWKAQVIPNLTGAGLFGYLDGSVPTPPKTIVVGTGDAAHSAPNPEYAPWRRTAPAVLGALLSSMTEEVRAQMTRATSAATVWSALGAMFAAQNRASVRQLRTQLSQKKKKDKSAAELFHKMTGYADALATVGEVLSDDEIIGHIIGGLGQEYDPLMTALSVFTGQVSLSDFYSYLLSFEARQEQHAANSGHFSSANNAMRHGNGNGSRDASRNSNNSHGS